MQGGVSEAHHTGNGAQIWIEVGVEGGVVVADGAVGILEACLLYTSPSPRD